jgi:excisionase family DNA binding protein
MTEYLTVNEVADLLRVNRKTVYREIHSGRLPVVDICGQFRVYRPVIDARLAYEPRDGTATTVTALRPRKPVGEFSRRARGVDSPASEGEAV